MKAWEWIQQNRADFTKDLIGFIRNLLSPYVCPRGNQQIHNQNPHFAAQAASLNSRLEEQARYIDALSARRTGNLEYDYARADHSSHTTQLLLEGLDLIPREQLPANARAALLAAVASPTHADTDPRGLAPEPAEQVGGRREAMMMNMVQGGVASDAGVKRADLQREDAFRSCQAAQAAAADARAQLETAERNWREGIRPIVSPTPAEVTAAKERLGYSECLFHVAVAGVSGSGKSSLVNALRGLRNRDEGAAPTSSSRVATSTIARFPDPHPARPFVWYDVPGAGTLEVPDWQYFTDQGLYIFDCIIVLFDTRLTATDIAILRGAARSTIPTYIVRSKALQHIDNLATDISGDGDDDGTSPLVFQRAREQYIEATQASVAKNLEAANLPGERVFLVDKDTLVKVVKGVPAQDPIDEHDLVNTLLARLGSR